MQRSTEWRTEKNLFESGVAVCPLNAKVATDVRHSSSVMSSCKLDGHYHCGLQSYKAYQTRTQTVSLASLFLFLFCISGVYGVCFLAFGCQYQCN